MAVFAVIAIILAVVAPRLLPMATYFGHEGAARELASFGESAIQYAKLNNEEVFVVLDFERGAYWIERWVPEDPEADAEDSDSGLAELQETVMSMLNDPDASEEDLAEGAQSVQNHFAGFAEQRLRARAELVEPNRRRENDDAGSMRASWGEPEDERDRQMVKEPFEAPLLERKQLPEGVFFESVAVAEEDSRDERVEVVISPLGLERVVRIKLVSEEGDVMTVQWDPIAGRGFVYSGDRET